MARRHRASRTAGLVAALAIAAPPGAGAHTMLPDPDPELDSTRVYRIAFLRPGTSIDAAIERVRARGVVVLAFYRGLHAFAIRVSEGGREVEVVRRDPATDVVATWESGPATIAGGAIR